jgi:hypothetical protein
VLPRAEGESGINPDDSHLIARCGLFPRRHDKETGCHLYRPEEGSPASAPILILDVAQAHPVRGDVWEYGLQVAEERSDRGDNLRAFVLDLKIRPQCGVPYIFCDDARATEIEEETAQGFIGNGVYGK